MLICHGGPGAAHDYMEPIADLSRYGRGCVLYDQVGCGRSAHLPDAPAEFWSPQLFKDELVALTGTSASATATTSSGSHGAGCSRWSTRSTTRPGLRAIVVADSPASMPLWVEEANRLRADLPPDVQEALTSTRRRGRPTTRSTRPRCASSTTAISAACPWPECVERSFAQMAEDPTVYHTMNGPSEFHCIGSLQDWDITDRLAEIDVPTLLVSGRYDEATPHIVEQIHTRIPARDGSSSRPRATCRTSRSRRRSSSGRGVPRDGRLSQPALRAATCARPFAKTSAPRVTEA